jgi:hypothetical protein
MGRRKCRRAIAARAAQRAQSPRIVDSGLATDAPAPEMPTSGCGAATWPASDMTYTIDVGGTSRQYIVSLPANYDTNHPYRGGASRTLRIAQELTRRARRAAGH